jgi:hypothetical protein
VRPLNVAVGIAGVVIAGVGVTGLLAPFLLLECGKSLLSANGLYAVAAVRVAFGLALWFAAGSSRLPRTLRIIGVLIIINGLVTPFIGIERSELLLTWFAMRGPMFVRVIATFAIAFGAFVVYAVSPQHTPPSNNRLQRSGEG